VRERFRDGVGTREGLLEVVESVSDSYVLHDITFVKDIRTCRGNDDVDLVFGRDSEVFASVDRDESGTLLRRESLMTHLLEEGDDVGSRKGESRARVDVGSASDEGAREERRRKESTSSASATLFVDDLDRFDAVVKRSFSFRTGPLNETRRLTQRVQHSIPRTW
jgi:hypothetical protein